VKKYISPGYKAWEFTLGKTQIRFTKFTAGEADRYCVGIHFKIKGDV
jgi:hypothetical protein